jgi:hypothetical protein
MAADYFLFLLGEISPETAAYSLLEWRPWSALYLKRAPMFLRNAEYQRVADRLLKLFHIASVEEFRKRLAERTPHLGKLFHAVFWGESSRSRGYTPVRNPLRSLAHLFPAPPRMGLPHPFRVLCENGGCLSPQGRNPSEGRAIRLAQQVPCLAVLGIGVQAEDSLRLHRTK